MKEPKTLQEAIVYFSDPQRAFDYAVKLRWPDGKITCPRCGHAEHSFISTRRLWFCKGCEKQFTVKIGIIFEDSALGLDKWMAAVWMLVNCKNGISSYEIHRALGVTQKTAWFMLQRIRLILQQKNAGKVGGPGGAVEVDGTFIGAHARNVHVSKREGKVGIGKKALIIGVLERGKGIRAEVVETRKRYKLQQIVNENVLPETSVYTDKLLSYQGLDEQGFAHEVIDHAEGYVRGQVHTNGLENFWSLLKRGLGGTYVNVEPFHLYRYLDEQVFRYNNRATDDNPMTDADRFRLAISKIAGKRLTYEQLTGKTDSPHHEAPGAW